MVEKILLTIGLSILGGILYRMGGKGGKWYYNTKVRDIGVPLIAILILWPVWDISVPFWMHLLVFMVMFGSMTTYWEHWGTEDVEWFEWLLTGVVYGLTPIAYCVYTGYWGGFFIRLAVVALFVLIWSEKIDNVVWEEWGRGFMFLATLPLLMLQI